jgi:hypothetical protein
MEYWSIGDWGEWREVKASLGCFVAPKPKGLKNLAQPRVSILSFTHKSEKRQMFGNYRLWYEWIQANSLCYFTLSRVALRPRRWFTDELS